MIVYEVNVQLDDSIVYEYTAWLREHIREMLDFEGFMAASVLEVEDKTAQGLHLCIQYQLKNRESLEAYFESHAERMREDGIKKFGGKFTVGRRILDLKESF